MIIFRNKYFDYLFFILPIIMVIPLVINIHSTELFSILFMNVCFLLSCILCRSNRENAKFLTFLFLTYFCYLSLAICHATSFTTTYLISIIYSLVGIAYLFFIIHRIHGILMCNTTRKTKILKKMMFVNYTIIIIVNTIFIYFYSEMKDFVWIKILIIPTSIACIISFYKNKNYYIKCFCFIYLLLLCAIFSVSLVYNYMLALMFSNNTLLPITIFGFEIMIFTIYVTLYFLKDRDPNF